jgi:hypothetical protein
VFAFACFYSSYLTPHSPLSNPLLTQGHRAEEVEGEIFDLFCALTDEEKLLEYPTLFASARQGWTTLDLASIPGKQVVLRCYCFYSPLYTIVASISLFALLLLVSLSLSVITYVSPFTLLLLLSLLLHYGPECIFPLLIAL